MYLKESQLASQSRACPFCHSQERTAVGTLQENPRIDLLECKMCRAVSASRIPTQETLVEFYRGYYHEKSYYGQEKKITFDLIKKFACHIIKMTAQHLKEKHLSILDFGGGDGSMAIQLAKEFLRRGNSKIDIMVVDYNESLAVVDDNRIRLEHRTEIDSLSKEEYGLVIASAIIEHLPEPREIMIKLLDRMKVEGLLYARTPYILPFLKAASALGLQWDFHYPSHIHDLGPSFWNRIFSRLYSDHVFEIVMAQPSIVETSFKKHFFRTLVAYSFKLPWYLFGNCYKMVGGWEILAMKKITSSTLSLSR